MIGEESFFDEFSGCIGMWCTSSDDMGELAQWAGCAVSCQVPVISAAPDDVSMLWTWLEKAPARIFTRFYLPNRGARDVAVISDLSERINAAFKQGASGAQVFMRVTDLNDFARQIGAVRDDLFFNKDLAVGLDIGEIGPFDWENVFDVMHRLRASALVLVLTNDTGLRSDFVGRLYAALTAANNIKFDLHFVLGAAPQRIEQAGRMLRAMRPELASGMRMFVQALPGGEK